MIPSIKNIWLIQLLAFVLSACGSTYNHETKQWGYNPDCVANRKDGRDPKCSDQKWNYVPAGDLQTKGLEISGQVFCGEGIAEIPANNIKVDFVEASKTLSSTYTDRDGKFLIMASVNSKASHLIQIKAKCGSATVNVPIGGNGNFELGKLNLK